jgi:glycosyltransferase involved in cell wall biosynthesis
MSVRSGDPQFSLVIPCYNEAANIPLLVDRCRSSLSVSKLPLEVVLVDNGSRDESPRILADLLKNDPLIRSVRVEHNQGYGFGILSGLRAATGRILGWTHADLQTDPADALRGLELFGKAGTPDSLFVKGRRHGRSAADVFFTVGMSVFETCLLRTRLWDINAQPTLFSRGFFETWRNPPNDFSLDLYAYHQARVAGVSVQRFPVVFGKRAHGISHWNVDWNGKQKFIKRTVAFSFELRRRLSETRSAGSSAR